MTLDTNDSDDAQPRQFPGADTSLAITILCGADNGACRVPLARVYAVTGSYKAAVNKGTIAYVTNEVPGSARLRRTALIDLTFDGTIDFLHCTRREHRRATTSTGWTERVAMPISRLQADLRQFDETGTPLELLWTPSEPDTIILT